MNLVERNDKAGFAPFDLSQTPKFDRSADKVELAIRSYDIASKYLIVAKLIHQLSFLQL